MFDYDHWRAAIIRGRDRLAANDAEGAEAEWRRVADAARVYHQHRHAARRCLDIIAGPGGDDRLQQVDASIRNHGIRRLARWPLELVGGLALVALGWVALGFGLTYLPWLTSKKAWLLLLAPGLIGPTILTMGIHRIYRVDDPHQAPLGVKLLMLAIVAAFAAPFVYATIVSMSGI